MAGSLKLIGPNGDIVRGGLAMGLTNDVSSVDHLGGSIFVSTDTTHLYWLRVVDNAVYILNSINVVNQIPHSNGAIDAICANDTGFWIAINATETSGNPPQATQRSRIHRYDLQGNYLFALPNFNVNTLFGGSTLYDLAWDGKYLYVSFKTTTSGFPSGTTTGYLRKMYWDDGRSINQISSTVRRARVSQICWDGRNLRGIKVNNGNMNVLDHFRYVEIQQLGAPGFNRADGLCKVKDDVDGFNFDDDDAFYGGGRHVTGNYEGGLYCFVN